MNLFARSHFIGFTIALLFIQSSPSLARKAEFGPRPIQIVVPNLDNSQPVLDITIRIHVEEGALGSVNARGIPRTLWEHDHILYSDRLQSFLAWESEISSLGIHLDFMADDSFWRAAATYTDTWVYHDGVNLAVYLQSQGHGVYPHDHGDYADNAYSLDALLGGAPPGVVGGFSIEDLLSFRSPLIGILTSYEWTPTILTGATWDASHATDFNAFGVWRPSDSDFETHDDGGSLIYVGHGGGTAADALAMAIEQDGLLWSDWLTSAIMVDYEDLHSPALDEDSTRILEVAGEISSTYPRVRFVNVEETVSYWEEFMNSIPTGPEYY